MVLTIILRGHEDCGDNAELPLCVSHGLMRLPPGPVHPEETAKYLKDKVQPLNRQKATATQRKPASSQGQLPSFLLRLGYIPPHHCLCRSFCGLAPEKPVLLPDLSRLAAGEFSRTVIARCWN